MDPDGEYAGETVTVDEFASGVRRLHHCRIQCRNRWGSTHQRKYDMHVYAACTYLCMMYFTTPVHVQSGVYESWREGVWRYAPSHRFTHTDSQWESHSVVMTLPYEEQVLSTLIRVRTHRSFTSAEFEEEEELHMVMSLRHHHPLTLSWKRAYAAGTYCICYFISSLLCMRAMIISATFISICLYALG